MHRSSSSNLTSLDSSVSRNFNQNLYFIQAASIRKKSGIPGDLVAGTLKMLSLAADIINYALNGK